jgi:hypothetical protein
VPLLAAVALACSSAGSEAGADTPIVAVPPGIAAQLGTLERLYVAGHLYPDSTRLWEDFDCEHQRLQRLWVDSNAAYAWLETAIRRIERTQLTALQQQAVRHAMERRGLFGASEAHCLEAARAGRLGDTVWLPLTVFSDQKARRDSVEKSRRDSAARPPPDSTIPRTDRPSGARD